MIKLAGKIIDFYKYVWNQLNWFGCLTFFPIILLALPVFVFVTLGEKDDEAKP